MSALQRKVESYITSYHVISYNERLIDYNAAHSAMN